MNPIDALERELVLAARRRPTRPRLRLPLAATLFALLILIPAAFATGLITFPTAHDTPRALGKGYVAASGFTSRGERWRFELTKGLRFRDGTKPSLCWALMVGDARDPRNAHGVCAGGKGPGTGGVSGSMRPISARDDRAMFLADVPRDVAAVRITFDRARPVTVAPLHVDQARARATGTPYPFGFVALAYAPHDRLTSITYLDANGKDVTPRRGRTLPHKKPPPSALRRVVKSPAL